MSSKRSNNKSKRKINTQRSYKSKQYGESNDRNSANNSVKNVNKYKTSSKNGVHRNASIKKINKPSSKITSNHYNNNAKSDYKK